VLTAHLHVVHGAVGEEHALLAGLVVAVRRAAEVVVPLLGDESAADVADQLPARARHLVAPVLLHKARLALVAAVAAAAVAVAAVAAAAVLVEAMWAEEESAAAQCAGATSKREWHVCNCKFTHGVSEP
jgi:hypothetical protein